ncbi:MAG: RNA methyltransferase [Bacteroidia bacterium]
MQKLKNEELKRMSVEEFKNADKTDIVIVLDNIRSMHNVGSIFRTADAFRIKKILLCGVTACPPSKEIEKTALGATETVEWEYFKNTVDALCELKALKYKVHAIEQVKERVWLQNAYISDKSPKAFVFGNEVYGVSDDCLKFCDTVVEIPQLGSKHSFNVAVSAGIILWEALRSSFK